LVLAGWWAAEISGQEGRTAVQEGLRLLSELTDDDICWLQDEGHEEQTIAGTALIREGERPDAIFVVLEGLVGIEVEAITNQRIALRGPGQLLGEVSFLDGQPASATVKSVENTLLLVLPRTTLEARLLTDSAFAARFYRACARVVARRLRERPPAGEPQQIGPTPPQEGRLAGVWERISRTLETMKELLRRADRQAILNNGTVPESLADEVVASFAGMTAFFNRELGDASGLSESMRQTLGAQLQRELLPYILLTRLGERMYAKPRGYAGDFLTIDWLYQNEPQGVGRLGPLLDSCLLNTPAAKAVRNRRAFLAEYIQDARKRAQGRPAQITSMACGPAAEVFDVFATLDDPTQMRATLIDIDFQALAFVGDRCENRQLGRQMDLQHGNLVYLALGRHTLKLSDQDLIYSLGLIDYFSDKFVLSLLNYVYTLLRPGGKVVLGNIHSSNPDKAFLDHVLDWQLIHRVEDDMNRLYAASSFGRPCTSIRFEGSGVNMFAECIKSE
jgi:extracellular factor (EF) 3-hydroxypalmitic acid methyl ester biosynthesis protein